MHGPWRIFSYKTVLQPGWRWRLPEPDPDSYPDVSRWLRWDFTLRGVYKMFPPPQDFRIQGYFLGQGLLAAVHFLPPRMFEASEGLKELEPYRLRARQSAIDTAINQVWYPPWFYDELCENYNHPIMRQLLRLTGPAIDADDLDSAVQQHPLIQDALQELYPKGLPRYLEMYRQALGGLFEEGSWK